MSKDSLGECLSRFEFNKGYNHHGVIIGRAFDMRLYTKVRRQTVGGLLSLHAYSNLMDLTMEQEKIKLHNEG